MDKFICVRIVQANNLDLTQFQFDYDLTFAVILMNADGTVYGRFGTRSEREEATKDISMAGFRAALEGALRLHADYPRLRGMLAAKRGAAPQYTRPEEYPSLKKYQPRLDYDGQVARSCMHCHQLGEAQRLVYREAGKPIPDRVLYPWPMPQQVGLTFDPDTRATVQRVTNDSPAAAAGIRRGDEISTLDGQPLLSIADVQWVLHNADDEDQLRVVLRRNGQTVTSSLSLPAGWRRGDISWRTTTWDLRRMGTGGLLLVELPDEQRRRHALADDQLALLVKHVGQYGAHAAAKRAGFEKNDVIVELDGRSTRLSESQLLGYALQQKRAGQQVPVTVLRGSQRLTLKLPQQ